MFAAFTQPVKTLISEMESKSKNEIKGKQETDLWWLRVFFLLSFLPFHLVNLFVLQKCNFFFFLLNGLPYICELSLWILDAGRHPL